MTWIIDGNGRRWVEPEPKKKRKSPRALRFAEIKVGDQLMQTSSVDVWKADGEKMPYSRSTRWFIVTDIWFDPVRGQNDSVAGQMVGIAQINGKGDVHPHKSAYPVRGLASNCFHYADRDYIAWCKERLSAHEAGKVTGIGFAKLIRARPKTPGL
jgi:hypothetical protein